MKLLTQDQVNNALDRMEVLRYFPSSKPARDEIGAILIEMIQTDRWGTAQVKLDWLIKAMRDNVGEWPGPKEFRGVYCCKFPPSDGIEAPCSLAGFDGEEGGERALCLSAPVVEQAYLPQPGDEPIGEDLTKQIAELAEAKRLPSKKSSPKERKLYSTPEEAAAAGLAEAKRREMN